MFAAHQSNPGRRDRNAVDRARLPRARPARTLMDVVAGSTITVDLIDGQQDVHITILDLIGRGGHATVVKGRLQGTGQLVALKMPRISLDSHRELLQREINTWQRAQHRHVLPLLGTCIVHEQPILISPLATNGNLSRYLFTHPDIDRQSMLRQVADGLEYFHSVLGVVHGDIKCQNILVSDAHEVVLADFGLSTTIDKRENEAPTITDIRVQCSLPFSPQELVNDTAYYDRGIRSKTTATDVYAYGMLVLEVFTGREPWETATNQAQMCTFIMRGLKPRHPGPDSLAVQRGLDGTMWNLCLRCWEFNPTERPRMCDIVGLFGGLPLPLPDEMRKVNLRLLQPTPEEENRGSRHPAQDRTTSHGAESRASERTCSTCRQRALEFESSIPESESHPERGRSRSSRSSGRDRPTRWRQREVTPCRISLQDTIREFMRMRSALPARTHKTGSSLHNHPLRSAVMGRGRSRATQSSFQSSPELRSDFQTPVHARADRTFLVPRQGSATVDSSRRYDPLARIREIEDDLLSEASRNQPLGNAGYYHPTKTQVSLARPSTPPPTQLRSVLLQPQYSTPLPRSPAGPSGDFLCKRCNVTFQEKEHFVQHLTIRHSRR